jgi:hypothetical protein
MKKFIILLAALFFVPASSSNVTVQNSVPYHLYYMILAKPISGGLYPLLYSIGTYPEAYGSNIYFAYLPPGGNALYSYTGEFPFDDPWYSPSSAKITHWAMQATSSSSWANMSNAATQATFGKTHRFGAFKFYMRNNDGDVVASGDLEPTDLDYYDYNHIDEIGATIHYFPLSDGGAHIFID